MSFCTLLLCLQICLIQTVLSQNQIGPYGPGVIPGSIGGSMGNIGGPIGPIPGQIGPLGNGQLGLGPVGPLGQIGGPIGQIGGPIGQIGGPIGQIGGPIGPLGGQINNGYNAPYGYGPGPYNPNLPGAYGGTGGGDVAVIGELPVGGTTTVTGNVPVMGMVQFGGAIPAAGAVTISGTCSCNAPFAF